jgi:hypothetical protein
MLRKVAGGVAIIAMFALAVPTLAAAEEHHPGGKPPPGGARSGGPPPGAGRQIGAPRAPSGPPARVGGVPGPRTGIAGPRPGGPQFTYHGRPFNRVHLSPFVYPAGYGYRRWAVGGLLPPIFLTSAYFYADWATLGLAQPQPGFQWVRYGPDLLLVNVATGEVVDVIYDAVY